MKTILLALALGAAVLASPAAAETLSFKADLRASNEVPPVNSPATGSLTASSDTTTKRLEWKGTVSGLTGDATAAHFHGPAGPGVNAGVLVPAPGVKTGAFEGAATLNDAQAQALTAGQTYFNIHTAAHPQGEVRGQVTR